MILSTRIEPAHTRSGDVSRGILTDLKKHGYCDEDSQL